MKNIAKRSSSVIAMALASILLVAGCASASMSFEDLARDWQGISATMTTYDQEGVLIDEVHGASFQFSLDKRFEEVSISSDGDVITSPGSVLLISVGNSHINHVGSSLLLVEDGVTAVAGADTTVRIENNEPGTPWLNTFIEYNQNLWKGKGKTLMIRSQDGKPIATSKSYTALGRRSRRPRRSP